MAFLEYIEATLFTRKDIKTWKANERENNEIAVNQGYMPFTGQRQHSRFTSGVSHALQTHDVKLRTFLAP